VWLGIGGLRKAAAKRFQAIQDPRAIGGVLPTLELAARLRHILPSTPSWKQKDLRARLLSNDLITPVLMEIDAAAHCLLRGFSIQWIEPKSKEGLRTPEMVVRSSSGEFEIECKSKSIDAGKKIPRRAFYELCDKVMSHLSRCPIIGIEREVHITVPDRFGVNAAWQNDLCDAIVRARNGGRESLPTCVAINVECRLGYPLTLEDAQKRLRRKAGPFGHGFVAFGKERVLISCRSMRPDHIVKAIEGDLSDAFHQLSLTRPARIMCYVPEVESFEVLKTGSSLQVMTSGFFDRHPDVVHSVVYVSDPVQAQVKDGLESLTQGLTFPNPHFSGVFPSDL
jgi:hypothetical protein